MHNVHHVRRTTTDICSTQRRKYRKLALFIVYKKKSRETTIRLSVIKSKIGGSGEIGKTDSIDNQSISIKNKFGI